MTVWSLLAGRELGPPHQQSGGVYRKYRGKNTRQNAPATAMTASRAISARQESVPVQILLLIDYRTRRSIRPPPARRRPQRASPQVEGMEMQHQYDYLHPYSIFTIRAISAAAPASFCCPPGAHDCSAAHTNRREAGPYRDHVASSPPCPLRGWPSICVSRKRPPVSRN